MSSLFVVARNRHVRRLWTKLARRILGKDNAPAETQAEEAPPGEQPPDGDALHAKLVSVVYRSGQGM
jgi:hypothetical protein